jgi:alpha-aminoadipic semialdehyde synthase
LRIGIRREDKSIWERRVPITPEDARLLAAQHGIEIIVQSSPIRVFDDRQYAAAGAVVRDGLPSCQAVFGIKEMPPAVFEPGKTYIFFAHVIKGQPYNMAMLRRLMYLGCNLIDYEKVTDDRGRRLVFFGRHAGLAGMIDTLWALGRRLDWEGIDSPFSTLRQAHEYDSLAEAKDAVSVVGERISRDGLPRQISPFVCGFAGYGNVFKGANEIIELLPEKRIAPDEIGSIATGSGSPNAVYTVVFREEHTVAPTAADGVFELQDYYDRPERYRSRFSTYLPHLSVLVNCVYWEEKYPRLVTKADVRMLYGAGQPRLRVIGDISCDIEGAIECTVRSTEPGDPVYVYDPATGSGVDGVAGAGPVIMAVDILPSELPREASIYFSGVLRDYVPAIAKADYSASFHDLVLPPEIKRALIVHRGELAPAYRYLERHVGGRGSARS